MNEKNSMGRWELGCLVFNSLIYKMFGSYPESYAKCGGSAAWITALFSGLVFLAILWAALTIYSPYAEKGLTDTLRSRFGSAASGTVSVIFALYFIFGICYAVLSVFSALREVAYVKSPLWFIALFFAIGAVVTVICGEKAVRRMHSLSVLFIGAIVIMISLLSLRYADIYNIFPILGKGVGGVFGRGLSTMFIYLDIVVILFLPKEKGNYSFDKTVMTAAILAVLVNVAATAAFSLNFSYELAEKIQIPLYPLTKTANIGKFPVRLDIIYQTALITSTFLYLSLALSLLLKCVKDVSPRLRRIGAAATCLVFCMTLCGCYDSREVEEKAYVIALGVDKGGEAAYRYTFQISNPLESGGSMGSEEKAAEKSDSTEGNKTVDNITVEADDYYLAADKLKSILSKEMDIAHIKVIVYSFDIAREGALRHSQLLLREREVRPGTNLCLCESAEGFLTSVRPTLEESTVRYYELFFRNHDVPYAPVTELRDFVGRSSDAAYDAVVPIVSDRGLYGMGVFSNGVLKDIVDGEDVMVYKLLRGELKYASVGKPDASSIVSNKCRPKIKVNTNGAVPEVAIELHTSVSAQSGDVNSGDELTSRALKFLKRTYADGCDVLGIGRRVKRGYLTQSEWETLNWDNNCVQKCIFSLQIITENGNLKQILQNN